MTEDAQVYLDNAATSFPKPESVYRAVDRYLRSCGGSPGRASHRKAREADEVLLAARAGVARVLGARDPARVVFTSNSTEALNIAIAGLLRAGDHVVLTDLEHNAVVRPLWHLRETRGIELTVVASGEDGVVDPRAVEAAIGPRTRLACCVHASNVLGTIQPVAEIGAIARRRGVPLLVDASQSAGVLPIDVETMEIDLLAFTGHKALLGPQGTGGLYVREGIAVEPLEFGGTGTHSESLAPPVEAPEAYEPGTCNAPGLAGLLAGVEYVAEVGVERIRAHEAALLARFEDGVRAIPGVRVFGPDRPEAKVAIALLTLDLLHAADVGRMLDRRFGIMVRSGLHCAALAHRKLGTERDGAVRFSFGCFNTEDDADCAAAALREIAGALC